jgi:PAS domain S-box-containing protein
MHAVGSTPRRAVVPTEPDPSWPRYLGTAAGVVAIAGGLGTLVGWAAGIPRLTDWKNDGISMFPNTAVCAVLGGIALLLGTRAPQVTRAVAAAGAAIGGFTLLEHLTGLDFGIDRLLSDATWGQHAAAAPMRMGPPASLSFLLTGTALLLTTFGARARAIAAGLGVTSMALATLSLTGHLYGAEQMFTLPRLTGIAFQTASIILLLGLGIVASIPEREPTRTLLERSTAGMLARRALPIVVGAALSLGWIRVTIQQRGLVDLAFGTALRTVVEVALLTTLLWWAVAKVRAHERARQVADAKVKRQAEELSTFLETATVGMHWVARDGLILWANDAELSMLGYGRHEYVGHRLHEFHLDAEALADMLARLHRGEHVVDHVARLRSKDGTVKTVLIDSTVQWDGDEFVHIQSFTRDVTERQRAEEVRALLAAIIEASDDAIVSKTLDGVVTSWNAGAERIFGYTAAEMIGAPIETVIPPERRDEEVSILARLRRGERIDHFDTVRRAKDGRPIDVSLTISPIKDVTGRIVGASKIARDVTDRKRLEVEREENDRRKDEFIAMLAHELRNPLAPIQNATRLMALLGSTEPRLIHARDVIERQVGQLTRLVDDLLDVSRITRGKVTLQRETLAMESVVAAAVEVARPLIDQLGHTLTVSHLHPVRLDGDFARLVQVVGNLLTNAAKFTPPRGRITVTTQQTGAQATIRVRDTGIGIASDFQTRIFDLFVQADGGLARSNGGLGIGLTLVRRIVEMHGGTIEVQSDGPDRGAEFLVTLPALPQTAAHQPAPGEPSLAGGSTPVRILVVDDNVDAAESLRMLLELGGHEVRVAHDGLEALEVVDAFDPDIAFVDVGLPGIDGYELATRLRAHQSCRSCVLVALTGYGRYEDKRRAADAGFDHHLTKPADFDAIDRLLANVSATAAGAREDRGRLQ